MKKDTLLTVIAFILLFFTLRSLVAENNDDYCQECCKKGRQVSSECCRECNGCDMYSDEGAQECRDFPA